MKIKSLLIFAVLVTAVLCTGGAASAQSADNSALIAQLQAQVQALLQQIAQLQAQQGTGTTTDTAWCYTFTKNMGYGAKGADYDALITVLNKEGLANFTSTSKPGQYNKIVGDAVVKLQAKYGISQSGFFGSQIRAKVNAIYKCNQPSITVTQPDSNYYTSWQTGNTMTISWSASNLSGSDSAPARVSIYLLDPRGGWSYYVIAKDLLASQGSYQWTIPTTGNWFGNSSFLSSSPQVQIRVTTFSTGSQGQTGDWEPLKDMADAVVHGDSGKFGIVSGTSTQPAITVTSPSGGETWRIGETHSITWTSSNLPSNALLSIGINGDGQTSTMAGGQIATNVAASSGSYSWTIPATLGEALAGKKYSVYATCLNCSTSVGYSSQNYFTIAAATSSTQPPITVTLPKAGDIISQGANLSVVWNSSSPTQPVDVSMLDSNGQTLSNFSQKVTPSNDSSQSIGFTTSLSQYDSNYIAPGQYKAKVCSSGTSNCGTSDYFTVVASTGPIVTLNVNGNYSIGYQNPTTDLGSVSSATITWSAVNADHCNTYGQSTLKLTDGTTWNMNLPTSGSKTFNTAGQKDLLGNTMSAASIGVQCWNTAGASDSKGIIVMWSNAAQPSITVTSPNGGETWAQGSTHEIMWKTTGLPSDAKVGIILQNADKNLNYSFASASASTGHYSWTVPTTMLMGSTNISSIGNNMKIMVIYVSSSLSVQDLSDNYFSITAASAVPTISMKINGSTATGTAGAKNTLSWMTTNTTSCVASSCQYDPSTNRSPSCDGLSNADSAWLGSVALSGSVNISPTKSPTTAYVLNCSGPGGSATSSILSYPPVIVTPTITVTSPNGGETWEQGSTHEITWKATGMPSTARVSIALVKGNMAYSFISPFASVGHYTWKIPAKIVDSIATSGTIGSQMKIKLIASYTDPTTNKIVFYSDMSDNNFSIVAATNGLSVRQNSAFTDQTISPNSTNVKIGSYIVQNQSTSESIRLTSLKVGLNLNDVSITNFSSLRTSDTTGSGATPVQPGETNNIFSVNDILSPGASMTLDIFASTGSSSTGKIQTTLSVSSTGSVSGISSTSTGFAAQVMTLGSVALNTPTIVYAGTTMSQPIVAANGSQALYNFVATGGAATITAMKFNVTGSDASPSATVMNICAGTVCAVPVGGVVNLTGLNLAVPNNASGVTQMLKVSYAPIGDGGLASGTTSSITLSYVKYVANGETKEINVSVSAPTVTLTAGTAAYNPLDSIQNQLSALMQAVTNLTSH